MVDASKQLHVKWSDGSEEIENQPKLVGSLRIMGSQDWWTGDPKGTLPAIQSHSPLFFGESNR